MKVYNKTKQKEKKLCMCIAVFFYPEEGKQATKDTKLNLISFRYQPMMQILDWLTRCHILYSLRQPQPSEHEKPYLDPQDSTVIAMVWPLVNQKNIGQKKQTHIFKTKPHWCQGEKLIYNHISALLLLDGLKLSSL